MTARRRFLAGSIAATALALLVLVTFQLLATSGHGRDPDGPRALFEQTEMALGKVPQWKILELTFPVRNVGRSDLVIQPDVSSSSENARPTVARTTLPPGDSGEVSVRIDVDQLEGEQRMLFVVRTNDPESPTVSLSVELDVEGKFWVEPRSIALGAVSVSASIPSKQIKVRWKKDRKVSVKNVVSHESWVQVASRPFESDGVAGIDVDLTFGPFEAVSQSDFSRSIRTTIEIETTHESHRKVLVPITASLQRAVVLAPRILELGAMGVGDRLQHLIDVRSVTGEEFSVLEVVSDAPYIRTELEEVEPRLRYRVRLFIEPLEPFGMVETVVTVRTDAPFCQELGCRLTGVVNP